MVAESKLSLDFTVKKRNCFANCSKEIHREGTSSAPLYNQVSLSRSEEQKKLKIQFLGHYYSNAM